MRRKAAGTLRVSAHGAGRPLGLGARPRAQRAGRAGRRRPSGWPRRHDPGGPDRLTAVPTILHSGDAFNVVPAGGELFCDLRADRARGVRPGAGGGPATRSAACTLEAELVRVWPGMDSRAATAELLAGAGARLGRPVTGPRAAGPATPATWRPRCR